MAGFDALQLPADSPGHDLYRINLYGTLVFVVAAVLSAAFLDTLGIAFAVLSCILFAIGCVSFLWAYGKALGRSRTQQIRIAGIYGMSGTSPKPVQRRFHLLTFVQSVVAIVTASIHPFTVQAFGILAPMLGLGLAGLWAAQHGTFDERQDRRRRRAHPQAEESTSNG